MPWRDIVLIVADDPVGVEVELAARRLSCPCCEGGVLGGWGFARGRVLRVRGGERWFSPRRARCRPCRKTHVLLPDVCLVRRRDEVGVIGAAIEAKAAGGGLEQIADSLAVPEATVRGWLRRFARGAEAIRAHFTCWAHALDPELGRLAPAGSAFADALEAIGVGARAWVQRFGPRPVWPLVAALSGGALLCNTSCPFAAVR